MDRAGFGNYVKSANCFFLDSTKGFVGGEIKPYCSNDAFTSKRACETEGATWIAPGPILTTTDGGDTWGEPETVLCSPPEYCNVYDIHFPTDQTGFAAAKDTILWSSDGGVAWGPRNQISSPYASNRYAVFFTDYQTRYLGGRGECIAGRYGDNLILEKTTNRKDFSTIKCGGAHHVTDIYFTDEDTGFFVTNNGDLHKTTDGGSSWAQKLNTGELRSIYFTDSSTGYAAGDEKVSLGGGQHRSNGKIFKTTDAGESWEALDLSPAFEYDEYGTAWVQPIESIHFANSNIGYAVTGGLVLRTTDAGETWTVAKRWETDLNLNSVYVVISSCEDSDGGIDYSVKGTISGDVPPDFETEDECSGNNQQVRETYCDIEDKDGDGYLGTYAIGSCPNGCEDGACLAAEEAEEEEEEAPPEEEERVEEGFDEQYLYEWAAGKTFKELIEYKCETPPCEPRVFINGDGALGGSYSWQNARKGDVLGENIVKLIDHDWTDDPLEEVGELEARSGVLRLDVGPEWVAIFKIMAYEDTLVEHEVAKLADTFDDEGVPLLETFELVESVEVTLEGSKSDRIEINVDGASKSCPGPTSCPLEQWGEGSDKPHPYTSGFYAKIGGKDAGVREYDNYFDSNTYVKLIEVIPIGIYEDRFNQAQRDLQDFYRMESREPANIFDTFILKGATKWKRDGHRVLLWDSDTILDSGAIKIAPKSGRTATLQVTVDEEDYMQDLHLKQYLYAGQYGVEFDDSPGFGKERITFTLNGDNRDYLSVDIDSEHDGINEFTLSLGRLYEGQWQTQSWQSNDNIDDNVWVELVTSQGGTTAGPSGTPSVN